MEFIFDGSHILNDDTEECLFEYSNGIALWEVYKADERSTTYLVKHNQKILRECTKISEGEAFIQGMILYAEQQGDFFIKVESNVSDDELESRYLQLKKENFELRKEKEKAQKLAEKLIKGIVKDKANQTENRIHSILEKYVDEL